MHWLLCVQLLSGIVFAHRKLRGLQQKNLIDEKSRPKLEMVVVVTFFFVTFAAHAMPFLQFMLLTSVCLPLFVCDEIFHARLRARIQSEFPDFVNRLVLSMKTGMGFRSAVEKNLASSTELWEKWLRTFFETRVFFRSAPSLEQKWWQDYASEFEKIQASPHHAIARLESLRHKLRVSSEFRRKSGQALTQARIQMVVMACLYLALLLLTMYQFSFAHHRRLILVSISLFLVGQTIFWKIARKTSWKV